MGQWVDIENFLGANNLANDQATAGAVSAELVPARSSRRSVTVRNIHESASCYIGFNTVTAENGFLLKAGESISIDYLGAVHGIRAASTDVPICYLESYD